MWMITLICKSDSPQLSAGLYEDLLRIPPERYTPFEGLNLSNQNRRKLGVFGRKLKGSHSLVYCYFDKY